MLIIAHRGASHDAPENTCAAARLAWAQGADALEVDVHLTRDGRLAVIHDPDTLRTAGIRRVVADATLAELQQLDVGVWKHPAFAGERVPALEEILRLVPGGKRIFVEIKGGPDTIAELQRCIGVARAEAGLAWEQLAVISFDLAAATAAKQALPRCEVSWLADSGAEAPRESLPEIAAVSRGAGLDGIDIDAAWPLETDLVQPLRAGGFKLYVWTVDDAPLARHLAECGIDGITTNRLAWLRAQLAAT